MTHRLLALYRLLSQPLPDEDEKPPPSPLPPAQAHGIDGNAFLEPLPPTEFEFLATK
jgi:hypothetical protein